jgi:hypothetical protein
VINTLAKEKMKKKLTIIAVVGVVAVACVAVALFRTTARGKLPLSARNVEVYSKSYGTQGWTYYLRAELPEKDFLTFVSRLRASHYSENPRLNAGNGHDIHWEVSSPPGWWDPSPVKANTYGRDNGMGLDIVKYENGHVYYKSTGS